MFFDRVWGPVVSTPLRAGRAGSELGARVDIVVSAGVRDSWRRQRGEPLLRSYRPARYEEHWREAADTLGATIERRTGEVLEVRLGTKTIGCTSRRCARTPE